MTANSLQYAPLISSPPSPRMEPSLRRAAGSDDGASTASSLDRLVAAARSVPNSPLRSKRQQPAPARSRLAGEPAIRKELIPSLRK